MCQTHCAVLNASGMAIMNQNVEVTQSVQNARKKDQIMIQKLELILNFVSIVNLLILHFQRIVLHGKTEKEILQYCKGTVFIIFWVFCLSVCLFVLYIIRSA